MEIGELLAAVFVVGLICLVLVLLASFVLYGGEMDPVVIVVAYM